MRLIRVGRLLGGHGLRGELKVQPRTDNPELFDNIEYLMLASEGKLVRSFAIEDVREHKGNLLIVVEGIHSLTEADKLKGLDVVVTEDMLPDPDDDEVYWYKIVDSEVVDTEGNIIGTLVDYMECGASDVFQIKKTDGKMALISNNRNHVLTIDTENRRVVISRAGLVDENI